MMVMPTTQTVDNNNDSNKKHKKKGVRNKNGNTDKN